MSTGDGHLDGLPLLLRADATTRGGTGHLMRSLALAQAWLDLGGRARWLLAEAPDSLVARIQAEGIDVVRIEAPASGPGDAALVRRALEDEAAALAVVDGEAFDEAFFAELGNEAGRVLLIDDAARLASYPVGWVLNQNAHADRAAYPPDATCRFLLGTRYVLLRREFRAEATARPTPERAYRLLVTFRGADPTGMTRRTIGALRRLPGAVREALDVRVIVGAANPESDAIEREAGDAGAGPRLEILRAVTDMPAQIIWAELAVTSGGSTVWELARYGCPALVVETVPVEALLVAGLARVGLFGRLGPERDLGEQTLADEIARKLDDRGWRAGMRARGMELVDGDGGRRVALSLAGRT